MLIVIGDFAYDTISYSKVSIITLVIYQGNALHD